MMLHTATLALVLFCSAAAGAQPARLVGTVTDERDVPLQGAHVILEHTPYGAATNHRGDFEITGIPPGAYEMIVSAVGYQQARRAVQVDAGASTGVRIRLRETVLPGSELVVTASRRAQEVQSVPVSLYVLGPADLESRGILTIDEALRMVPGVEVRENQVNVRGSSGFSYGAGSRVLLLVDGMPMLSADQGDMRFDVIPASQIARIEIIKGPGSALYGGGALGGIVHVLSKDFPEEPSTPVQLQAGAYQPVRYQEWRSTWPEAESFAYFGGIAAGHTRRIGPRAGFWANVQYRANPGYLQHNSQQLLQAHAKLGLRPAASLKLDLLAGVSRNRREIFLFWNSGRDALRFRRSDFITGGNDGISEQYSILPAATHVLSPRLFYTARGRLFSTIFRPLNDLGQIRSREKQTFAHRYGGDVQLNWMPAAGRFVVAGFSGDGMRARSEFYAGEDERQHRRQPEGAAFIQLEQTLFRRLHLVAGGRYDVYRLDAGQITSQVSPKLNLSFDLHPAATLRGSYGQGFRVPSTAERYVNNRDFLPLDPNPDLRPELSEGFEAGIRMGLPLAAGWTVRLDLAGHWTEYHDLVEPRFVSARNAFQFTNLTRARIRGVESSIDIASLRETIRLQAGYGYLDPLDTGRQLPLVFRTRHLFHTSASVQPSGRFHAGVDFRYASKPERLDSDFSRFVQDADLMVPVRVVDIRLGVDAGPARVSFIVKNALDYYYVERPALLAPPRHFLIQIHKP